MEKTFSKEKQTFLENLFFNFFGYPTFFQQLFKTILIGGLLFGMIHQAQADEGRTNNAYNLDNQGKLVSNNNTSSSIFKKLTWSTYQTIHQALINQQATADCTVEKSINTQLSKVQNKLYGINTTNTAVTSQLAFSQQSGGGGPAGLVKFVDLRGVEGHPQWDSLSVCGDCDTISIFVVTNSPTAIQQNVLTVNLPDGLKYCGQVGSSTTIGVTENDVSNPSQPKFAVPDMNSGNSVQLWFTVKTECDVLETIFSATDDELSIDYQMDYVNAATGESCYDIFFPSRAYNNALNIPVLNILNATNLTLADGTITSLPVPNMFKTEIEISQNGIRAALDDFVFRGDYDENALSFVSMTINGVDVTSKVTDNGDLIQVLVDDTDFANNAAPLSNLDKFEEDERLMIEIIWEADYCSDFVAQTVYNAFYSCGGMACESNTDDERTTTINLDGPDIAVSLTAAGTHPTASMCNLRSRTLTLNNTSATAPIADVGLNFNTSNICGIEDVLINGISVFDGYGNNNSNQGEMDFTNLLTTDPDGPGGLEDLDGDGFFDDIAAGNSVPVTFMISSVCDVIENTGGTSCVSTSCTYRPSARMFYKSVCGPEIFYTNYATAWVIQSHGTRTQTVSAPANLALNQSFNITYNHNFFNFFASPASSCSNYSFDLKMALPNGVQFNSATWKGVAIPNDSIQIIGDTLCISTQALNHTNLTTLAPLAMNFTNLICVNDVIDWTPIVYANCNDDLPDCGCTLPYSNTTERPNCSRTASTVRLGCTCPWINTTAWDIQRTSVGYTDKTMTTKVDPASLTESNLDAFISCDSFEFFSEGVVRGDGYDSLMLQIGSFGGAFFLENFEGTLEVVNSAGVSVPVSCGSVTGDYDNDIMTFQDPFIVRNLTGWEINLSDCLSESLNTNDTVRFYAKGVVRNIPTTNTTNTTFQSFWSVYDTTALVDDWAECNALNDPISLRQYAMFGTGDIAFNSFCEGEFTGIIHPGVSTFSSNPDAFPNEVRFLNNIDSIYIFAEGDIDESSIEISIDGSSLTSITPSRSFPSGGNTVFVLDIDPSIYPPACTDYIAPNDTVAYFNFMFQRNCTANDAVRPDATIFYQIYYSNFGNLENDPDCKANRTDNASGTNDIMVSISPPAAPELSIQVSPKTQILPNTDVCFTIEVTNIGSSESFVTWLGAENLSGGVAYETAVRDGNTLLTIDNTGDPIDNQILINLDTVLAPTEKVSVELCVTATSCGLDTLTFYTGWECTMLPEDIVTGNYGGFTCPPVSDFVTFEILDPQIQLDLLHPTTDIIPYCEPETFIVEIKNVRQGPAFLDSLFVYLPLGEGLQVVSGSFEATYPSTTGTPITIADPIPTGATDINMGNQYVIDDFTNALGMLQSIPGIDGVSDSNRVLITFDVVPTCGYNNQSIVSFQANGHNICDESIFSNLDLSPRLSLPGVDSLINNEYLIFLEPSLFTTCAGQEIFEVNILNDGPAPSSPDEMVCITIPDTVPLVANSFNFFNPSGWNPAVSQDSVGPGINKYCFTMPAGVPDGGIFSFNFEVDVDEDTPCGIYPFFIQTIFEDAEVCDYFSSEEECNLAIQTSLNKEFGVTLRSSLTGSNVKATYDLEFCSNTAPNQITYELDAFNNDPVNDFPAGQASVKLYVDVNQNGVIDLGTDQLVGEDFISQIIPANSTVSLTGGIEVSFEEYCANEYLLELSNNAGCECGSEVFPVDVNASNLFGSPAQGTTCGSYTEISDYQECDDISLAAELFGLDPDESYDYYDIYFDISETDRYTLTDGAGNPLVAEDYLSYMEYYSYFESYGGGEGYMDYYLYFEHFQCSPDGIFLFTIHLPTEDGCTLDFDIEVTCSDVAFNTNLASEEVICSQEDTVCINIFDYMQFEDSDGNIIDITAANSPVDINTFSFINLRNASFATLYQVSTDTISSLQDLTYEVCLSDNMLFRLDYSGSCYISQTLSFTLGENDTTFNLTLNHPEEICLGDTAMIIMEHSGIFEGITVQSGDALNFPSCNNLTSCDTILVFPTVTTTYTINMTDSLGCPQDTFFTINVRNTESPLVVTVDDNLLCSTSETAMVCIEDTRADNVLGWKKDGVDISGTAGQTCISVNEPGTYSVTAQDDLGCDLSGQNTVFIQPMPEPPILQFGDSAFCVNNDSVIVSTVIGFESYEWFQIENGVTTSIATDVSSFTFSEVGTFQFYVEVTDLQGCAGQSDTLTLTGKDCFVDLMLSKNIVQQGTNIPLDTVYLCDTVTYQIIVENRTLQGDSLPLDARNVTVMDSLPTGLVYAGYSSTNGTYDSTTGIWDIGFLRNGRADTLSIDAKLDSIGQFTNVAEISSHDEPDIDSSPDNMGPTPTEDDEDEATIFVEVFDLALSKVLAANQSSVVAINQDVTYWIIVENQGNINATDVLVTDYVPTHLSLSTNDTNGWATAGANITNTIPSLLAGTMDTLELIMTVSAAADADSTITNFAEISEAKDDEGVIRDDFDSTADNIDNNDDYTTDNDVDGQAIQNPGEDEDDHDPAEILVGVPDLALVKMLAPGTSSTVLPGDLVTYDITIYNQGSLDAYNVTVLDYIPTGLNYSDTYGNNVMDGWSDTDADGNPAITLSDSIPANTGTQTVQITLQVNPNVSAPASLTNIAEIAAFEDEHGNLLTDIDSTPDTIATNDGAVEDDAFMNENGDEDDSDPAVVMIDRFDLALTKTTAEVGPFSYGDTITFDFTVYNQGTVPSTNIEVTEYMPCGYSLVPSSDWTSTSDSTAITIIRDTLQGGDSSIVSIDFIIEPCTEAVDNAWNNTGEISASEDDKGNDTTDDDIDSDADDDPSNDGDMTDNDTDGTNGDEDDSDFELIEIVDLAQKKELVTAGPYNYGDTLTYAITVYNQGNVKATNIELTDHVPAGLDFIAGINPDWSGTAPTVTTTVTDTLCTGDSAVVNIQLVLLQTTGGATDYTNISEISSVEDDEGNDISGDDIDSTPDNNPTDDNGGVPNTASDNQTDGDGTMGEDEDDHDPAIVEVFDLALKKTTAAVGPFSYGDIITFDFTVYNQGNVPSTNIEITENMPCGYALVPSTTWTNTSENTATTVITDTLQGGDSTIVSVNFIIEPCTEAVDNAWNNTGEISASEDDKGNDTTDDDIDSDADDDPSNDGDMTDNDTDGTNGDEDDSDFERIEIVDLAQKKELVTVGPYNYGDTLTYAITVYNQGNVKATNIELTDHVPAGLDFIAGINPDWSGTIPTVTTTVTDTLCTGDSAVVNIQLVLLQVIGDLDDYTNISEISGVEDAEGNDISGDDIDSTPDSDPTDDNGGEPNTASDNQTDGDGTIGEDEDDHDPAIVKVFDLALKKTTAAVGPFSYGDIITFDFTVYNQGNVPSTNIEITENMPCGYALVPSTTWTNTSENTATTVITDTLQGGDSTIVSVNFIIEPCTEAVDNAWNNTGEISASEDHKGNDTTDDDIDSDADNDPSNDGDMTDNDTDGTNGDEDDSDFERIEIFDLALTKNLAPGQTGTVYVGDIVAYQIAIHNQGNITAYDIEVTDYAPASLLYEAIQNTSIQTGNDYDWTMMGGNPTYLAIDSLQPLETTYLTIRLSVDPSFSGGDLINYAEISHASIEKDGANTKDADSDADDSNGNDNGGTPGSNEDNNIDGDGTADEDDHDPAKITTIANYAVIVDPCTCLGNGLIGDKVAIYSTKANEIWSLTVNTGMYNANSTASNLNSIPLGTTANYVGLVGGLHRYELPLIHLDNIGYNASFTNGINTLSVSNLCSCPGIITSPDGTPPPPDSMIVVPMTKTPVENTLTNCDAIPYTSSRDEHQQYVDTAACRIVQTICPTDQWKQITFNFSEFDLAAGDTLCVFEGKDTLRTNQIGKWSGTGVSQTGGWISSHCSPTVNPTGCLTFLFKTNGDNNKGLGWTAEVTCNDRGVTLNATDQNAILACEETHQVFTINPATIAADCGTVVDSQIVRVFNAHGDLCMDTCLAATDSFDETFGLGTYFVEYKLKSDTVKQTRSVLTVQEAPLVCNDKVSIPLGSACNLFLTPDDLLEGPCDTITDSVYYFITLKGLDKNGNEEVLATGGGKGGNYPTLTKEMIDQCGGTITAEIEKRYYDGLNLTFCNNGPQSVHCDVEVEVIDQTVPFFTGISTVADTFRLCGADLSPENLGIPTPTALDNCTEATVEFSSVNILTDGSTCDTTRAQIIWTATDACGNEATLAQSVVILRPELTDIVMPTDAVLSCGEDAESALTDLTQTGVPHIQIGKVVNGVLQPTGTLPLDTVDYVCGYIIHKTDVSVPADCGIKVFRTWNIVDWCDAQSGPQPLGTQFIELRDTLAPTFVADVLPTRTIDLAHFECTYDITTLENPIATDNCSAVTVNRNAVFRISNGERLAIEASELTELDCDSFLVQWIAQDACHEQVKNDTITQLILIEDNTAPSAICVDKINLSLGQNDAKLHYTDIDGGSSDACGIVTYEVSRDEVNWDTTVTFGCEDAHAAATVYLRVTDAKGNQSICWMTVNVEDKIAPICSDLPDMTGNCEEQHLADLGASTDANDNGLLDDEWVDMTNEQIELFNAQYGNPNCSDNITCGSLVVEQQYQLANKKCGIINIQRRFRAIDWDGEGRTSNWSTQNINIESEAAWSVTLPVDWKGACGDNVPSSEVFIQNGNCDLLAYEVEEKVFTITEDACLKVVRTFTITNWCNYEAGQPAVKITRDENEHGMVTNTRIITSTEFENAGRLEYIQILKLQDDTAPVITIGSVDNCIEGEDCNATKRFAITANDCNTAATIDLAYNWAISTNGTQLATGEGSYFEYEVAPNINYEVNWSVADNCGNTAKETANYEFKDCKKPAPYCLNGTAVELMSSGMIQVWATDFERGSTDNCTSADKLNFRIWHASLGDAPTDLAGVEALPAVITFDCATLGQQDVSLYVIDEAGNWDFCTTYIIVQDNMNACENLVIGGEMAVVSGTIKDWKEQTVEEVQVQASSSSASAPEQEGGSMMTQTDGHYHFELAMNNSYTVKPSKQVQPLNGVSTFDLVLISKHILGISEFDNPYQMIAADVNKSGSITAFDMVQIRQLILNIKTEFTNNESWRFVDAAYEFTTDQPLTEDFPEVIETGNLTQDMEMDFVAVKIGDVNGNAQTNSLAQAEDRTTTNTFEITTEDKVLKAGQTYTVEFNTTQLTAIQGYQFTLGYENLKLEKLNSGVAGVENFGLHKMDDGMITTSWNGSAGSGQPSTILFNIKFTAQKDGKLSEQLNIINRPTAIEAYNNNGELMDVQLTFTTPLSDDKFELFQNQPNPFHDKTVIGFNLPGDAEVQLVLRDETGRVLKTIKQDGTTGYNTIPLEIGELTNGFIYYQLSTKFGTQTKKMIQLK